MTEFGKLYRKMNRGSNPRGTAVSPNAGATRTVAKGIRKVTGQKS